LDAARGGGDVGLEDPVELVDVDLGEPHERVAADDVHQHMQRAGLLVDLRDGSVSLVLIDHVERDEMRRAGRSRWSAPPCRTKTPHSDSRPCTAPPSSPWSPRSSPRTSTNCGRRSSAPTSAACSANAG